MSKNTTFLLLQGGTAPVIYPGDAKFQKRFRIFYYDYGCPAPIEQIAIEYNSVMFK
ncbi:FEKKY domain-containing protein [Pedobacter quisquiliarum]|uniref:FEKKY domain-containing protein n=1 Tax=Pedobacter quisquiliarum TaxID=1834438 RepID=UPI0040330E35